MRIRKPHNEARKFRELGSIVTDVRSLLTNIAKLTDSRSKQEKYFTDALDRVLPAAMRVSAQALERVKDVMNVESLDCQSEAEANDKTAETNLMTILKGGAAK